MRIEVHWHNVLTTFPPFRHQAAIFSGEGVPSYYATACGSGPGSTCGRRAERGQPRRSTPRASLPALVRVQPDADQAAAVVGHAVGKQVVGPAAAMPLGPIAVGEVAGTRKARQSGARGRRLGALVSIDPDDHHVQVAGSRRSGFRLRPAAPYQRPYVTCGDVTLASMVHGGGPPCPWECGKSGNQPPHQAAVNARSPERPRGGTGAAAAQERSGVDRTTRCYTLARARHMTAPGGRSAPAGGIRRDQRPVMYRSNCSITNSLSSMRPFTMSPMLTMPTTSSFSSTGR
jgi:hypothetical protein